MSKFTYDQLMKRDKDDLVQAIIDYKYEIEHLLKCMEKLMKDK